MGSQGSKNISDVNMTDRRRHSTHLAGLWLEVFIIIILFILHQTQHQRLSPSLELVGGTRLKEPVEPGGGLA